MSKRKTTSTEYEEFVFTKSARRCAFCFGLKGDFSEKKGQIAHVDKNPGNNSVDNLAWLCFEHHDAYDSKTSQSKNLTQQELIHYRNDLHVSVDEWRGERHLHGPHQGEFQLQPTVTRFREIPNLRQSSLFADKGLQLIADPDLKNLIPAAVLTVFTKTSMFMVPHPTLPLPKEKWLSAYADLSGGFQGHFQVQGKTPDHIGYFMGALKRKETYGMLAGPDSELLKEFLTVAPVKDEKRLVLSMHTVYPQYSGTNISFGLTYEMADRLILYLEETGFSSE